MNPSADPGGRTVLASFPEGEVGCGEISEAELERARHALAYLTEKLGNEAMRALLSRDLDATTTRTEEWLAASDGTWQSRSVELIVAGPSATEFHDWYQAMVSDGRESVMRAGHPEHFLSHPQPEFIEVIENVGETDLPWRIFYHALAEDDPSFPSEWDRDFPVRFGAEILNPLGSRIGFTMHQSRDAGDGMHLRLTTHLPAAVPNEVVRRHLRHFAIEFTNWTRVANQELHNRRSRAATPTRRAGVSVTYTSINPYDEQPLASYENHSADQIEGALTQAHGGYQADWRCRSHADRGAILRRAGALLRDRSEHFARLATLEMGKLLREAREEVFVSADIFEYYAEHAETLLEDRSIPTPHGESIVQSLPLGVIFAIEPWNYPYYQVARVAAPNLMAGNTVIVKHAPGVPQCALAIEALFRDAGAPDGVYSNVFASDQQAADVIADRRVRGVALTGSERAGQAVAAQAGKALKKSTMELGGSDAFIVLDDADLDEAVRLAMQGRLQNTGQACAGAKRFIVHQALAEDFVDGFTAEMARLTPGDPLQAQNSLGPLSSRSALERALEQIENAVRAGAELVIGGARPDRPGFFLEPTVLTHVDRGNPAFYQEFFAPVAMIFPVANDDDAIAVANDSPYGLGGSVITRDIARGKRLAQQLDTGMVFINSTVVSVPELPFGGVKNSGFGRELSDLGIGEFVNKKLILVA